MPSHISQDGSPATMTTNRSALDAMSPVRVVERRALDGRRFIFEEEKEDDEGLPRYISWVEITRAR